MECVLYIIIIIILLTVRFSSRNNCNTSLCVSMKWEVPPDYINVILGIKDNLTKDLVYILMAKGLHCIAIKV